MNFGVGGPTSDIRVLFFCLLLSAWPLLCSKLSELTCSNDVTLHDVTLSKVYLFIYGTSNFAAG